MSGGLIGPEYDAQIRGTIRDVGGKKRRRDEVVEGSMVADSSRFPPLAVILDAALAAVTNPKIPSSALATVCKWSVAESKYFETDLQIRVYNHSFTAYAIHTMGAALNIDGHHWFFGDCTAMSSGLRS